MDVFPRSTVPFPTRVHLLGIGGAGQSALGRVLVAQGRQISGHDRAHSDLLVGLAGLGIEVTIGPSDEGTLPDDVELVVRSAAVPADDPQVVAAGERGIDVIKYSDALGRVSPADRTIGVAGTHGKTSTSWMLWHALEEVSGVMGDPIPGAIIGGTDQKLGTNGLAGMAGGWFVVEACEYDRTFLRLDPFGAIVTNVEEDHLDAFGSLEAIEQAFARYVSLVHPDGLAVFGRDVPAQIEQAARCETWRLGRELEVDLLGEACGRFKFRVRGPGWAAAACELAVPGQFNVENAALAIAMAIGSGRGVHNEPRQTVEAARAASEGVAAFRGVARRFEAWGRVAEGEAAGTEVVHDYAHHPTEVRVTLEAARRAFPGMALHVLFQPHQHSRTARFLDEFVESLRFADRVVVADVYGARVHADGDHFAGSREIVDRLVRLGIEAVPGGGPESASDTLAEGIHAPTAVLVLGAGDIDGIRARLLADLCPAEVPAPAETGPTRVERQA